MRTDFNTKLYSFIKGCQRIIDGSKPFFSVILVSKAGPKNVKVIMTEQGK